MRSSFARGARLLLLAGALGLGCNSLVGNDPHQLDPTIGNTGAAGAHGGGSGQLGGGAVPSGGANGGPSTRPQSAARSARDAVAVVTAMTLGSRGSARSR